MSDGLKTSVSTAREVVSLWHERKALKARRAFFEDADKLTISAAPIGGAARSLNVESRAEIEAVKNLILGFIDRDIAAIEGQISALDFYISGDDEDD